MKILVVDIGGSHVKIRATGEDDKLKFSSSSDLKPQQMVCGVKELAEDWEYDAVSIGYPGKVRNNLIIAEPYNLGEGWVAFDFESAFDCPVRVLNDAAMQALGSYCGGKLLFLGLGTGLGSAMVIDDMIVPLELAHLPYKKGTFEDYLGKSGRKKRGKKKWRKHVAKVVGCLTKNYSTGGCGFGWRQSR